MKAIVLFDHETFALLISRASSRSTLFHFSLLARGFVQHQQRIELLNGYPNLFNWRVTASFEAQQYADKSLFNFKTIQNVDAEQLNLVKNLFVDYKYKCKSLALPLCCL